jgi:hypothetical protein
LRREYGRMTLNRRTDAKLPFGGKKMKTLEELRNQARRIINIIAEQKLTVEEGLYVIECAKWFLTFKYMEDKFGKKEESKAVAAP